MTDEAYFTGKGDYQFDIYRMMRTETEGDWSKHTPRTNIFWMHYLVDKMISGVKFEAPVSMVTKRCTNKSFSSMSSCSHPHLMPHQWPIPPQSGLLAVRLPSSKRSPARPRRYRSMLRRSRASCRRLSAEPCVSLPRVSSATRPCLISSRIRSSPTSSPPRPPLTGYR